MFPIDLTLLRKQFSFHILFAFLLIINGSHSAYAEWLFFGPVGGDVECIQVDAANGNIYIGTDDGSIYKSVDSGSSWEVLPSGLTYAGYVIKSIQITHHSPSNLYTAAWGLWGGGGIFRSNNDGITWEKCGLPDPMMGVKAFLVIPGNPDILLAATPRKLFRSQNGDSNWIEIPIPDDIQDIYSLAVAPESHDTVYIGTYRLSYRTNDGGVNWEKIDKGMKEDSHIFQFAFSPRSSSTLFTATCGWIYKSKDSGNSWTRYKQGLTVRRTLTLSIHPDDPKIMIAGTCGGAFKSKNNGLNWKRVTRKNLVVKCSAISPGPENIMYLGSENCGILRSMDRGESFQEINTGFLHMNIAEVEPVPSEPGLMFCGIINGGEKGGLHVSYDSGRNWEQIPPGSLFSDVFAVELSGNPYSRVYIATENGIYWRDRGSNKWQSSKNSAKLGRMHDLLIPDMNREIIIACGNNGLFFSDDSGTFFTRVPSRTDDETFFTLHAAGNLVYAGSNRDLYRSSDYGQTWESLNVTFGSERIQCVLHDPVKKSHIYVGTFKGLYHGSPDSDEWKKIGFGYEIPDISDIQVDPFDPDTLIATSYLIGGVYVNRDKERRWKRIDSYHNPIRAYSLSFDPHQKGRLYIGTYGHSIACNNNYVEDLIKKGK